MSKVLFRRKDSLEKFHQREVEVCGDAASYCDPHSHVDIARSILRLLNDPAQREVMVERGRARARAFTWEACAEGTSRALIAAWNER